MSEENKTVARRFIEALSTGDVAALDELVAEDCEIVGRLESGRGREVFRRVIATLHTAFPDLHTTIEELIAEGDSVVVRLTERGTHRGAFVGISPTGKSVTWSGVDILEVHNGRITKRWGLRDRLELLEQLNSARAGAHGKLPREWNCHQRSKMTPGVLRRIVGRSIHRIADKAGVPGNPYAAGRIVMR